MRRTVTFPENNPLFEGIDARDIAAVFECLEAKERSFAKDDYIMQAGRPVQGIVLILTGAANVIKEDYWGNRTIIDKVVPGELVGETFACAQIEQLPLSLIATQKSEVLFLSYKKMLSNCQQGCRFHNQLAANSLKILANKNSVLMSKVEHMTYDSPQIFLQLFNLTSFLR